MNRSAERRRHEREQAERMVDALLNDVFAGRVATDAASPITDLAREHGVSRAAARNAIVRLQTLGLAELLRDGSVVFVAWTGSDLARLVGTIGRIAAFAAAAPAPVPTQIITDVRERALVCDVAAFLDLAETLIISRTGRAGACVRRDAIEPLRRVLAHADLGAHGIDLDADRANRSRLLATALGRLDAGAPASPAIFAYAGSLAEAFTSQPTLAASSPVEAELAATT